MRLTAEQGRFLTAFVDRRDGKIPVCPVKFGANGGYLIGKSFDARTIASVKARCLEKITDWEYRLTPEGRAALDRFNSAAGRGRPRCHADNASKQAAYRERRERAKAQWLTRPVAGGKYVVFVAGQLGDIISTHETKWEANVICINHNWSFRTD